MKNRLVSAAIAALLSAIAFMPLLASCCCFPKRQAVTASGHTIALPAQVSGLSCSSVGIPPQITSADVRTCAALLSARDAQILQVCWEEHGQNILTDGLPNPQDIDQHEAVHNLDTCPILFWNAKYYGPHQRGEISDLQYAQGMEQFMKNKHKQGLQPNCRCVARLHALGIDGWE